MKKEDIEYIENLIEKKMKIWSKVYTLENRVKDLEKTREKYKNAILRTVEVVLISGIIVYAIQATGLVMILIKMFTG
jgi:hypothetical protein